MRTSLLLLLLTPLLFAYTQMNIYNDKAQLFIKEHLDSNIIENIPQSMIEDSFIIYTPKITNYIYKKGDKRSLYDIWNSYKNKTVLHKNKKVTLRFINPPFALIESPDKKLKTVELKEILFPPFKGSFQTNPNQIILPKKAAKKEIRYGYMLGGIHWKSFYTLMIDTKKSATLKGIFEVINKTQRDFHLDALRLIAGHQNSSMHPPALYYRSKSSHKAQPVVAADAIESAPLQNYYSYSYNKPLTLPAKAKSFIYFLDTSILITKKYTSTLSNPKYFGGENKNIPQVSVEFKTPQALPYGRVLFLNEKKIYLGDATLPNTPKENKITLSIGQDFFSLIKERLVDIQRYKHGFRSTVEYTLTNRSKEQRTYELLVPLQEAKSASITTTRRYSFKNANTILFKIDVAPGKQERFEVIYEQRK